ncbi:YqeY-like protein [Marvinbryantia formatexigens DSM 14469]|uniref:YqeY-like protein n=2 Tax=Marvinbryantia TaxID=248744 RepID=C6LHR7_9FIRM|nr:YqeY-like protein [Marvinbryantia formatexigens DSM 14469]
MKMELATLQKDMIAAMKAKDKPRKEAISALVSAVKKAGIDAGCREDIPETMVDQVILKEMKTAKEQLDTCPAERTELKAEYQFRYDVISSYAPKLLSAEEVKALLQEKYAELLATKNKSMIMKTVMAELKGKADGKVINQVVAELCK